ncbi:dihydropteroate synthase [Methylonatrum kenyense]|uniref:dihydropteroate synthase n=1 Tax=Methylonatrum kenyense TaxID=455253 RepID=UPI0020C0A078|nr:dihydropteroate synthase [Methylonatrum kenyense]MCK8515903.1 dihydropteroate synthase [Methylonatrum kenyense]
MERQDRQGPVLECGRHRLDLAAPRVMGILNVTPDSFSDGGHFIDPARALDRAHAMVEEGADLIDVGGESTRPGSEPVPLDEERGRIMPVLEALCPALPVPVSVDTSKPEVMRAAAEVGVGLLNDVNGLRADGALEAAAETGLPVCLMHMLGTPRTMQEDPRYRNVTQEILDFLLQRVAACEAAGLPRRRLLLDPGFGFGKRSAHNFQLLRELDQFVATGLPVLVGMSRKGMVGQATNKPPQERLHGSVAAAVMAATLGARIIRVHDVAATREAMDFVAAVLGGKAAG